MVATRDPARSKRCGTSVRSSSRDRSGQNRPLAQNSNTDAILAARDPVRSKRYIAPVRPSSRDRSARNGPSTRGIESADTRGIRQRRQITLETARESSRRRRSRPPFHPRAIDIEDSAWARSVAVLETAQNITDLDPGTQADTRDNQQHRRARSWPRNTVNDDRINSAPSTDTDDALVCTNQIRERSP